jgi:hypothetical protein
MPVLLVIPALWVLRAHLHGIRMAAGETAVFVRAGVVHALVLAGVVAALGATALPGVGAACLAVVAGLLADVGVTWRARLIARRRGTTSVPEPAERSSSWPSRPPPTSSTR